MTGRAGLTWPEAVGYAGVGALLAIPVGSTEQHGPHLPLSIGQAALELLLMELCRSAALTFGRVHGLLPQLRAAGVRAVRPPDRTGHPPDRTDAMPNRTGVSPPKGT